MAISIVSFKTNVSRTLDILPTPKELKTRSWSHAQLEVVDLTNQYNQPLGLTPQKST
jgi:hypothetical protein